MLYGLRQDIMVPPWMSDDPDKRIAVINEALSALEARGFDADSLVRVGLRDRLERSVVAGLVNFEAVRYTLAGMGHEPPQTPSEIWLDLLHTRWTPPATVGGSQRIAAAPGEQLDESLVYGDPELPLELMLGEPAAVETEITVVESDFVERVGFAFRCLTSAPATTFIRSWIDNATLTELVAWSGAATLRAKPLG